MDGKQTQANAVTQDAEPDEYHRAWEVWERIDAVDQEVNDRRMKRPGETNLEMSDRAVNLKRLADERAALLDELQAVNPALRLDGKPGPVLPREPGPTLNSAQDIINSKMPEPVQHEKAVVKRCALIERHIRRWPSIERDLRDGAENGLSAAARAESRGWWDEEAALRWAEARGKLEGAARTTAAASSLEGFMHRIKG